MADGSKNDLRREIRIRKKEYTQNELKELSQDIMRKLLEISRVKEARTIMLYCSLPDEVYTIDAIHTLKAMKKRILLPAVISGNEMELREYIDDGDLKTGSYNIMEPCGKPFREYNKIDVIVVPGMAFDDNGNRLGRGKGYYDRFLERTKHIYKIGICFPFQKLENIPTDEYDIRMDIVVS